MASSLPSTSGDETDTSDSDEENNEGVVQGPPGNLDLGGGGGGGDPRLFQGLNRIDERQYSFAEMMQLDMSQIRGYHRYPERRRRRRLRLSELQNQMRRRRVRGRRHSSDSENDTLTSMLREVPRLLRNFVPRMDSARTTSHYESGRQPSRYQTVGVLVGRAVAPEGHALNEMLRENGWDNEPGREMSMSPPPEHMLDDDDPGDFFERSAGRPDGYVPAARLLTREDDGPDSAENPTDEAERSRVVPRQVMQREVQPEQRHPDNLIRDVRDNDDFIQQFSDPEDDDDEDREENAIIDDVQLPLPPPPGDSSSEDDVDEDADDEDEGDPELAAEFRAIRNRHRNPNPQVDAIVGAHIAAIDEVRYMPREDPTLANLRIWRLQERMREIQNMPEDIPDFSDLEAIAQGRVPGATIRIVHRNENATGDANELPQDSRIHAFLSDLNQEHQSAPGSDAEAREAVEDGSSSDSSLEDFVSPGPAPSAPSTSNLSPEALAAHQDALQMIHRAPSSSSPSRREPSEAAEAAPASPPHANPPPEPPVPDYEYAVLSFSASFWLIFILLFVIPHLLPHSSPSQTPVVFLRKFRGYHISCLKFGELLVLTLNFMFFFVVIYETAVAHLIQIPLLR